MQKAKKKSARRGRPRKPRQQFLPGMKPRSKPAIDDAADIYFDAMQERVRLSKEEKDAKNNLIEKMNQAGLTIYETPHGLIVSVLSQSNVKCKRKNDPDSSEGDE